MSYQIQDIFTRSYAKYAATYTVSFQQDKVARAIISCKTSALGGNVGICDDCGHIQTHYNSCRNRHCPCCQGIVKVKWIDQRKADVIDAPYFHIVFTVPEELNALIYANKKLLYTLLYKASAETLQELAGNKKYLGAEIGFMSLLHTWGSNISYHPHIHSIVLGGGLTPTSDFKASSDEFIFPVRVVSKLFRGKFLAYLKSYYTTGKLVFSGSSAQYRNKNSFFKLLNTLYRKEWIPHVKETFKGAVNVIEYLGRYTHRIAISNNRIVSHTATHVTFRAKSYKEGGENKEITVTVEEFIRRFLMHVLPKGFVKIRHYGILSNSSKKKKLALCRRILKGKRFKPVLKDKSAADIVKILFGVDITKCPNCGSVNWQQSRLLPQRE